MAFQVHCSVVVVQVLQSVAFLKVLFWSLPDYIVLFFFPYLFTQAVCGMSIGLAITVIGKNRDQVRLSYLVPSLLVQYRVFRQLPDIGWVDLDLGSSAVSPILHDLLSNLAPCWSIPNIWQLNPGPQTDGTLGSWYITYYICIKNSKRPPKQLT